MRRGSWRDPEVARDAKVAVAISVTTLLIATVPSGLVWVFLGPVLLGALVAILLSVRVGARSSLGEGRTDVPHRGYNISRIAVAGFPGLVLVGGFVWMFWSGLPIMRPVVVTAAVVGCFAGLSLIVLGRWHRTPEANVLGLASSPASSNNAKAEGR
jgi:hypothetical protein